MAKKKPSLRSKLFTQGYICALTTMIRSHGLERPIIDAWGCNKLTKEELVTFEIEGVDVECLMEHWDELNHVTQFD